MKCAQEKMLRKKVTVNIVVMVRTGSVSIKRVERERISL